MGTILRHISLCILLSRSLVSSETYSVNITTSHHVNVVDSRFVSFTVDPKYLFASSEKYSSKECICMASSLTPAYLRIAGPSTSHMTFHNATLSINDLDFYQRSDLDISTLDDDIPKKVPLNLQTRNLAVTHRQWKKFVYWAKSTGFDLVFALNNEDRTSSGMWDPNTALNILTVAEKVKVGDIYWELGYECTNQSIEEYLNDLETLRVIIETFPPGRTGEWKVVGGDVTKCLKAYSKSDFKDYLTLSNDMMDALLLNGNSSYYELQRMSEKDRLKLQRLFYHSETPLWLTETTHHQYNGFGKAADWLSSLGDSAKNGFAVHYRELEEEELNEPTLSFYMALLFKNLVGERVLDVQMDPLQAILFAHCTSLRHKPVPGAVTLFGANIDDEPARFSVKLSRKEEGGDIMQFILGMDHNGNIVVNGRAMYYEGDIRPVVKRVRPYKTLLINLPAKSFGFWVLANTKIEACHYADVNKTTTDNDVDNDRIYRDKRSTNDDFEDLTTTADISFDFDDSDSSITNNKALKSRITDMNRDLDKILTLFKMNSKKDRFKREDARSNFHLKTMKRQGLRGIRDKLKLDDISPKELLANLFQKAKEGVNTLKSSIGLSRPRLNKNRVSKRHSKGLRSKNSKLYQRKYNNIRKITRKPKTPLKSIGNEEKFTKKSININNIRKSDDSHEKQNKNLLDLNIKSEENKIDTNNRRKRNIDQDAAEISAENDIDFNGENKHKLWKMLRKIQEKLDMYSSETDNNDIDSNDKGIVLKTELSDDSATIQVKDSEHGVLKTTVRKVLHVLEDLNSNVNKIFNTVDLLG